MPPKARSDPYPHFNFQVIVTGISNDGRAVSGSFSEVTGLGAAVKPIEYRNGVDDITPRKIPGLKTFTDITLTRGVTGDVDFWKWIVNALNGKVVRASGAILLLDENRNEVMRWTFDRAWPCEFTGPTLNAGSSEIALEKVKVCAESVLLQT